MKYVKMIGTVVLLFYLSAAECRILNYNLKEDSRKHIPLSTFGFLKDGTLSVNLTKFSFKVLSGDKKPLNDTTLFGFTLDKSGNTGLSMYIQDMQENCILQNPDETTDNSVSMVYIKMDHINKKLIIDRRGKDIANLIISPQNRDSYLKDNMLNRRDVSRKAGKRLSQISSDDFLIPSRHLLSVDENRTATENTLTSNSGLNQSSSSTDKQKVNDEFVVAGPDVFSLVENSGVFSTYFLVAIRKDSEEGLYNLIFHNCLNYMKGEESVVNLSLDIIEDNNGNFLSAGEMPEPPMFFTFSIAFFISGCCWLMVLRKSENDVYKIHFLMLMVVFVKSLSSIFHGVNSYFIQTTGIHEEAWAILYYIVYLTKGALMFITILLIGAGWAFIKHLLSDKEKKLFLIVIPLQILDQVAWVIVEESEEGQVQYTTWKEIFILVDLLCCGAILFPVVWSIRHLQEASRTDGKAAMNLNKLKLFRQFYILIVCFIYFTRIIVYLLKITLPFKFEWLTELFRELATLLFFIVTGFKFRPASDNPYLQIPVDSDDEIEMEEVLTKTGANETLVKVNQHNHPDQDNSTENHIKQRESSHEYD